MENDLNRLKERIKSKVPHLTNSQKIIANYIVENPARFAVSSIRQLEEELGISKSTIVRLAQALGYEGFYELRNVFLRDLRKELDPISRYKSLLEEKIKEPDFMARLADESVKNIHTTLHVVDRKQLAKAIELIEKARHVATMGLGISAYLADIASYLLNRVSINAKAMSYGGLTFTEQIINLAPSDVVVAFSFPPYSPETIEAAEYAHESNVPVIAITDKLTNPIYAYSEVLLQVPVESSILSNSIVSVILLLYTIVAIVGQDRREQTLHAIESLEHVRKEHRKKSGTEEHR